MQIKPQQSGKLVIAAIVFGLLAAAMAALWLKAREAELEARYRPKPVKKVEVIVPTSTLAAGSPISPATVATRQIPASFLPPNVLTYDDFEAVEGRLVVQDLPQGRPIPWSAVLGEKRKDFSDSIKLGSRAKTIRVTKINSFDGMLRPGNHIDLFGTFSSDITPLATGEEGGNRPVLYPVLQNLLVMATGTLSGAQGVDAAQRLTGGDTSYSTISVQVSPREAAKLTLAESLGELTAVLRNREDDSGSGFEFVSTIDVFQSEADNAAELVYDRSGNLVGRKVGDRVVDENGNVVAEMNNGLLTASNGDSLGGGVVVSASQAGAELIRDDSGQVVGIRKGNVVYDEDGKVVARVVDDRVVDLNGRVLNEEVDAVALNGCKQGAIGFDGKALGTLRGSGIYDANGIPIARVENGQVLTLDGLVITDTVKTKCVDAFDPQDLNKSELVLDDNGNVVGVRVGKQVFDAAGNVVATIDQGEVIAANGKLLAKRVRSTTERKQKTATPFVEFIAGGVSKKGVATVKKLTLTTSEGGS